MSSFEGNSQIQQKKKCAFVNKRGWGQCEVRAGYRQLNSRMWPHSSCVGGATAVSSLRGHCCVHLAERFKKKHQKKTGPVAIFAMTKTQCYFLEMTSHDVIYKSDKQFRVWGNIPFGTTLTFISESEWGNEWINCRMFGKPKRKRGWTAPVFLIKSDRKQQLASELCIGHNTTVESQR